MLTTAPRPATVTTGTVLPFCRPAGKLTEADLDQHLYAQRADADATIERLLRQHFADTQIEPWELPHMAQRANDAPLAPRPFAGLADLDTLPMQYANECGGCTGRCEQGERPCDCKRQGVPGSMWALEWDNPWLLGLYAAVLTAFAAGFKPW